MECDADATARNADVTRALFGAVRGGDIETVRAILAPGECANGYAGSDADDESDEPLARRFRANNGRTHPGCWRPRPRPAAVPRGSANLNTFDADGANLLHIAAAGPTENLRLLLEAGADPSQCDAHGVLPAHCAMTRVMNLRLLLDYWIDALDWGAVNGDTLLHFAVTADSLDAVRALLELGADPRKTTRDGLTPLHLAGSVAVVGALLAAGAVVDARDVEGATPLHRAPCQGIAEALIGAGADPVARTADGSTPLDTARARAANATPETRAARFDLVTFLEYYLKDWDYPESHTALTNQV